MSEFTWGNLVLAKHQELLKENMDKDTYLVSLNEKWVCYLTKEDSKISSRNNPKNMENLSNLFPILHISYAEDHGFSFYILDKEKVISKLNISFELEYTIERKSFEECFGEDILDYFYVGKDIPDLPEEIKKRDKERIDKILTEDFSNINIENFRLFDIEEIQIKELKNILTKEYYKKDYFNIYNKFTDILNIENFGFVSWNYVHSYEEEYSVIAKR